jgi:hypothetical protein
MSEGLESWNATVMDAGPYITVRRGGAAAAVTSPANWRTTPNPSVPHAGVMMMQG